MEAMIHAPIFVLDREGWISVFDDVASAEIGLEVPDVESGEYVALDAAGRLLSLAVVAGGAGSWFTSPGAAVRIVADPGPSHPELLRRALAEASSSPGTGRYLRARETVEAIRALKR